ncbi:SSI family serine proteinase inhibitor [Nonomuraea typhae]|uniref:SSI family serine proteinase inhibitor n=1 Tax=Nonomuraea typhae TaxID=2603600 RepID=A0ABW7YTW9_9ACTN
MLTTGAKHVLLVCDGKPSMHPRAAEACAALSSASGDFGRLPVTQVLCTKEYNPVHVSATGVWEDRLVRFVGVYGNRCEMNAATGPVFAF